MLSYLRYTCCHVKGGFCEKPHNLHFLPLWLLGTLRQHTSILLLALWLHCLFLPLKKITGGGIQTVPCTIVTPIRCNHPGQLLSSANSWLVLLFFCTCTRENTKAVRLDVIVSPILSSNNWHFHLYFLLQESQWQASLHKCILSCWLKGEDVVIVTK